MLIKKHGVTMTRDNVCAEFHTEPNTLRAWVATGRFPKPMHHSAKHGGVWATQAVARYVDEVAGLETAA